MSMVRRSVEAGGRRRKSRGALTSRPEIERLLDAARAPASPRELAGERQAVDLFAHARLVSSPAVSADAPVRTRPARTGLKATIAAAGAVGLLSSGVSFAATGHVPFSGTITSVTQHVIGQDDHANTSDNDQGPKNDQASQGPQGDESSPSGPEVAALQGLCHAYAKGQKATHGHALEQRPFTALVTAAGGEDQVSDFCAALPPKAHQGNPGPTHPTHPTTGPSGEPSGDPTHPAHPTKPVHPTTPTHPTSSSHEPKPSHPTKKPHPAEPTRKPSQTAKPHPSHTTN
jgi:hypothetical protein